MNDCVVTDSATGCPDEGVQGVRGYLLTVLPRVPVGAARTLLEPRRVSSAGAQAARCIMLV